MSTAMIYKIDSTSSDDTERLGELLGSLIKPPMVLELVGDLGAGKTSLARGLVHGYGSKQIATSPSFSLSNVYETDNGKIYHFDLYRLGDDPGVLQDELAEALADPKAVVVVEWGVSVRSLLSEDILKIRLKSDANNPDKRRITLSYSQKHENMIKQVELNWMASKS